MLVFSVIYYLTGGLWAFLDGNRTFVPYLLQMGILIAAMFLVDRGCNFSRRLLWCFSIWGLLHMAGGLIEIPETWPYNGPYQVLYSLWLIPDKLKYDQVIHAYGFGITTWSCWEALRNGVERRYRHRLSATHGIVVLCVVGGMGFGAINEVVEFIANLTNPGLNIGGYVNTGWDLVYNALGATVAGLLIYFRGEVPSRRRE